MQGGGGAGGNFPPMVLAFFFFFCLSAQSRTLMMIIPLPHYGNNFATKFVGRKRNVTESPPPPTEHLFQSCLCTAHRDILPLPPSKHPGAAPA